METIKTEKEKVIKEQVEFYRAFDGKEFSSMKDCMRYELVHKYDLKTVSTTTGYYEFYTVNNTAELKEMILLSTCCEDFRGLSVILDGTTYKNMNLADLSSLQFPMTLTEVRYDEGDWSDRVVYKSLDRMIKMQEDIIKNAKETLNELNNIKESI